ncbi:MAG TPA: hypothetical protein VNG12_09570 [Acidimicrobiales bacterium]|nr:hypothetical protein [Acidimicrobiales bacterium]
MATASEVIGAGLVDAFPGSRKPYVTGSRNDIRVPTREITLSPTPGRGGDVPNASVRVYDTSGPYTDAGVDIRRGLPAVRVHGFSSAVTWRNMKAAAPSPVTTA